MTHKTRETRLRRMAERQGLRLTKSKRRDPRALDYGEYYLSDPNTNALVAGDYHSLPDLDAVERRLTSDYYIDLATPEGHEFGPAASLPDLAYPVAHALMITDKQGAPRPPYKIRAEEDGTERGPTEAEQVAFTAALERALSELDRSRRTAADNMITDRHKDTA